MKTDAFFENARLLQEEMQIVPLLYGSLGLEYLTKENLGADDIDILISEIYLSEQWAVFHAMLERNIASQLLQIRKNEGGKFTQEATEQFNKEYEIMDILVRECLKQCETQIIKM